MKKFFSWLNKNILYFVLLGLVLLLCYGVFLQVDNIKLKEQNTKLEKDLAETKTELDNTWNIVYDRNNEIYRLQMIADEWKELFYAEIDFHPYEGPDW